MRGIYPALGIVLAFALAGLGASAEDRPPVHAEEGSVAIGGNVSNSTIGVPYEKLEEAVRSRTKDLEDLSASERETVALLKEKLDLNQRQVASALEIVGEANVPPERLAAKLVEIAEKYKDLQTAAAAQPGDDSKITALKAEAQKAVKDGQLGKADDLLAAIEKIQNEALDRLALNAAQTTAQRGDVASTQLRYLDAAQRFADAAAKVPQGHDDERWKYLNAEAAALYRRGYEFGDNAAALAAIERYRHLVELRPRNAFPRDWAITQNNLGNALWVLGERESGTARLEEAVAAFREALQEHTRTRTPIDWAGTQMNLGVALRMLGERESGTARLEEAVAAFREALQEDTRARAPLQWALTQVSLGNALLRLGERESGTARPEEAVAAFREALQEYTRARAA
jgi:tetratricopeptide (TPR) repeat protein